MRLSVAGRLSSAKPGVRVDELRLAGEMVARGRRRSGTARVRDCWRIPGRHAPALLCLRAARYCSERALRSARLLADSGAARPGSALFRGGTPRICSVSGRRPQLCSGSAVARAAHSDNPPAHLTIRLVPTTKETRHRRSGGRPVPHRPNAAGRLRGAACPTPPSAACPNPTTAA